MAGLFRSLHVLSIRSDLPPLSNLNSDCVCRSTSSLHTWLGGFPGPCNRIPHGRLTRVVKLAILGPRQAPHRSRLPAAPRVLVEAQVPAQERRMGRGEYLFSSRPIISS